MEHLIAADVLLPGVLADVSKKPKEESSDKWGDQEGENQPLPSDNQLYEFSSHRPLPSIHNSQLVEKFSLPQIDSEEELARENAELEMRLKKYKEKMQNLKDGLVYSRM